MSKQNGMGVKQPVNDGGLRRLPVGEGKSDQDAVADMGYNKKLKGWGNEQVPENSRLVKFYQNPFSGTTGEKRTIDESLGNGGMSETEAGEKASITNHVTGHLGTHKI